MGGFAYMSEDDYWVDLEFRVCREFEGMPENHLRFRWCDGFIPERYLLNDQSPCITGHVWICNGQEQEKWEFTLVLNQSVSSPSEIDWASLLPPENVTKWMGVDLAQKRIEIEPSAGVPDLQ